jgi:hypothetical protein
MYTIESIDFPALIQSMFFVLLLIFSIYGIFLAYHWYTFGESKNTSTIALAVYLCGGAVLFLTLAVSMGIAN